MKTHLLIDGRAACGSVKSKLVVLAALVVLVGLFLVRGKKEEFVPEEVPPVNVATTVITPVEALADTFTLPGTVKPWACVRLAAEVPGRVEKITVREGDTVKPGQCLICLEKDLLQTAYDQAKAKADYDARELERLTAAAGRNVATPMEVDIARSAAAGSAAVLEQASVRLRRAVIQAPMGFTPADLPESRETLGILNNLPVEIGALVAEGTFVAEIVDIENVKVQVNMPERDVHFLKLGDKAFIHLESPETRTLEGEIIFISSTADERTRTFRTEIRVPNRGHVLRGEMIVNVQILRQTIPQAVMVPLDAIIPLEHGYEVYINDNGVARRRTVKLGIIKGQVVQALEPQPQDPSYRADYPGLKAGDRLIVRGHRMLGDGQKVVERNDVVLPPPATQSS